MLFSRFRYLFALDINDAMITDLMALTFDNFSVFLLFFLRLEHEQIRHANVTTTPTNFDIHVIFMVFDVEGTIKMTRITTKQPNQAKNLLSFLSFFLVFLYNLE